MAARLSSDESFFRADGLLSAPWQGLAAVASVEAQQDFRNFATILLGKAGETPSRATKLLRRRPISCICFWIAEVRPLLLSEVRPVACEGSHSNSRSTPSTAARQGFCAFGTGGRS